MENWELEGRARTGEVMESATADGGMVVRAGHGSAPNAQGGDLKLC
jgi:hypothetical protein